MRKMVWSMLMCVVCCSVVNAVNLDDPSVVQCYLKFDTGSGNTAYDSSGNGFNGEIRETCYWTTKGFLSNGIEMNPVAGNTRGQIAMSHHIYFTNGFSLTCWVKNYGQPYRARLFSQVFEGAWAFLDSDDRVGMRYSYGTVFTAPTLTVPRDGKFHFVAIVGDDVSGMTTFYVDGVSETTSNGGGVAAWDNLADGFYCGNEISRSSGFHGIIDEWRVFNAVLTPADVARAMHDFDGYAAAPVPANGTTGIDASSGSITLEWMLPWPVSADPNADPNSVTCDVFISEISDMSNSTQLVTNARVESAVAPISVQKNYYWRVDCYDAANGGAKTTGTVWTFSTVPLKAYQPVPADDATDVSIWPTLTWDIGVGATSHKVYFSTDESAVTNRTVAGVEVTSASYAPATPSTPLTMGQQYFWAVDEVKPGGVIVAGDVWSFMATHTEILDDFSAYRAGGLNDVWKADPNGYVLDYSTAYSPMVYVAHLTKGETVTFTRDLGADYDLSQGMVLIFQYANSGSPYPDASVKLLDANNAVLVSDTFPCEQVAGVRWERLIDVSGIDLSAVRKISASVIAKDEPAGNYFYMGYFKLASQGVCVGNAGAADLDENCVVDLSDFALFAAEWLECTLFPASVCDSL